VLAASYPRFMAACSAFVIYVSIVSMQALSYVELIEVDAGNYVFDH